MSEFSIGVVKLDDTDH